LVGLPEDAERLLVVWERGESGKVVLKVEVEVQRRSIWWKFERRRGGGLVAHNWGEMISWS